MTTKFIKVIFAVLVVCGFILFILYGYYNYKKAYTTFIEQNFSGVIIEIKFVEGNRGLPDFKIDNRWIYLGLNGDKVNNYIKITDSIVKKSGEETIKVFRKNNKGGWDEKVFN